MAKDGFYFPHFSNSRHDRKIKRIVKELGVEGYGLYFMTLEVLREQTDFKYPLSDIDLLADEFNSSEAKLKTVIMSYDLFQVDTDNNFFSQKFIENMTPYLKMKEQRSIAGKKSAEKRQHLLNIRSTTVEQSKVKESKVNKVNEIKEKDFINIASWNVCNLYDYSELNEDFKKLYDVDTWNAWKSFNKHIDENFSNIREIESQMKIHEYVKLRNEYIIPNKISKNKFLELLSAFNNYKPAKDKYNSVTPALISWIKNNSK